jgi:hypothetical protein
MGTESGDIAKIIKDQNDNNHGAPELVFDDESQNIIAVPAGKAKDTGMPEVTQMGTDVFH